MRAAHENKSTMHCTTHIAYQCVLEVYRDLLLVTGLHLKYCPASLDGNNNINLLVNFLLALSVYYLTPTFLATTQTSLPMNLGNIEPFTRGLAASISHRTASRHTTCKITWSIYHPRGLSVINSAARETRCKFTKLSISSQLCVVKQAYNIVMASSPLSPCSPMTPGREVIFESYLHKTPPLDKLFVVSDNQHLSHSPCTWHTTN